MATTGSGTKEEINRSFFYLDDFDLQQISVKYKQSAYNFQVEKAVWRKIAKKGSPVNIFENHANELRTSFTVSLKVMH